MKRINQSPDVRDILVLGASLDGNPGLTVFASIESDTGWYGVHFTTQQMEPPDALNPNNQRVQFSISRDLFDRLLPTASLIPDTMARSIWPYLKDVVSRAERAKGLLVPDTTAMYFGRRFGESINRHSDQIAAQRGVQFDPHAIPRSIGMIDNMTSMPINESETEPDNLDPQPVVAGIRDHSTLMRLWVTARSQPPGSISLIFNYSELIFMQSPEFEWYLEVRGAMRYLEEQISRAGRIDTVPSIGIDIEGTIDLDAGEAIPDRDLGGDGLQLIPLNPIEENEQQRGETFAQYTARLRAMSPTPIGFGPLPLPILR